LHPAGAGVTLERRLRERLDNWKLWVGIAYFGLSAVVVALFFVNQSTQRTLNNQTKEQVTHRAEIVANANSRFSQCRASIPELSEINRFVDGVQTVEEALVKNSAASVAATKTTDPQYKTRVKNLQRLRAAKQATSHVRFPVPTLSECATLKAQLLKEN
jgi:hypothetical protein